MKYVRDFSYLGMILIAALFIYIFGGDVISNVNTANQDLISSQTLLTCDNSGGCPESKPSHLASPLLDVSVISGLSIVVGLLLGYRLGSFGNINRRTK